MKLKQEKSLVQKRIKDTEGAISVHQFYIDYKDCDLEEFEHHKAIIEELMVDLEAYRHYLICLNSRGEVNEQKRNFSM